MPSLKNVGYIAVMRIYIQQILKKLIKKRLLFFIPLLLITSCKKEVPDTHNNKKLFDNAQIKISTGELVKIKFAITEKEQIQGLSGITKNQFKKNEGLLFFYRETGIRKFWMPNTFFDLDIFYLDKKLKVLDIVRNLPAHPGYDEPPLIPRAKA
ncbi:MAG: DUF192 domain-containing protein, partial [Bdellovibrionota bacterium]|nr:DUF192 domain-containing protein [Bdellovibrionota bacterium]